MEMLGAKHTNILWLLKHLDFSLPKKNVGLSLTIWTVAYNFSRKKYSKQYTGRTESLRYRFNNYKPAHWSKIKGNNGKQAPFYVHFKDKKYHGKRGR